MAKGRIEQEIALVVTGVEDVKTIDRQIAALEKKKHKLTLDVDDGGAAKKIGKIDEQLEGLSKRREVAITANVDKALKGTKEVLDNVNKLDGETATVVLAIKAAEIESTLSTIRQELAQIDGEAVDVEVRAAQAKELVDQLEKVKGTIKEVNATPVEVDTSPARKGFDDIGKSVDQAKSVSANAIGNITQDLGALGGVAGSAGVAIGQFGEYFADAAGAGEESIGKIAKNFLTVAGPLTVATVGVGLLTQAFTDMQAAAAETETFDKERVRAFADALNDAKLNAEELREALATGGEEPGIFIRIADQTHNVERSVAKLFTTFEHFNAEVARGTEGYDEWSAAQVASAKRAGASSDSVDQLTTALADARDGTMDITQTLVGLSPAYRTIVEAALAYGSAIRDSGEGSEQAGFEARFYGKEVEGTANALDASASSLMSSAAGFGAWTDDAAEAADVAKEFNKTISSVDFGKAGFEGAVTGMSKFHDQFFGLANIAADSEEAFDNLSKSLEDNGKSFDLNTEKGRGNQKALEDLGSVVDVQLVNAFDNAGGSLGEFSASAKTVADTLRNRLINEMGLSATEADELIAKLGLMPKDIETRYKLSGTEEAKIQLQLLEGTISRLPKNVQGVIDYKIAMGDYVGAQQTAQNYMNRHPVTIPVELRVSTASLTAAQQRAINAGRGAANGTNSMPEPGGIAGEAGGEFVRLPSGQWGFVDKPTYMPPRTKVISVRRTRSILRGRSEGPTGPGLQSYAGGTGGTTMLGGTTVIHNHTNVNAAVVGSRYDVAKAVGQGNRDLVRLLGRRGTGVR